MTTLVTKLLEWRNRDTYIIGMLEQGLVRAKQNHRRDYQDNLEANIEGMRQSRLTYTYRIKALRGTLT